MKSYEERLKEIETIQERTIAVKLSDADCRRVAELCGAHGITVSELMEHFIGDLVDGTYSHGSDEQWLAKSWFERCPFGMFPQNTFLRHLITDWGLEDCIDLQEAIDEGIREIGYLQEHPEICLPGEIVSWQNIRYWKEMMAEHFERYQNEGGAVDHTLEDGMKRVMEWKAQYERLLATEKEKTPAGAPGNNGLEYSGKYFYDIL